MDGECGPQCLVVELEGCWRELVPAGYSPGTAEWENMICLLETLGPSSNAFRCKCGNVSSRKALVALLLRYRLFDEMFLRGKGSIRREDLTEAGFTAWKAFIVERKGVLVPSDGPPPEDATCPVCQGLFGGGLPVRAHSPGCGQVLHYGCFLRSLMRTDVPPDGIYLKDTCPVCRGCVELLPARDEAAGRGATGVVTATDDEVLLEHPSGARIRLTHWEGRVSAEVAIPVGFSEEETDEFLLSVSAALEGLGATVEAVPP